MDTVSSSFWGSIMDSEKEAFNAMVDARIRFQSYRGGLDKAEALTLSQADEERRLLADYLVRLTAWKTLRKVMDAYIRNEDVCKVDISLSSITRESYFYRNVGIALRNRIEQ